MAVTPQQPKEFEEKVIAIDRVARVVKGGEVMTSIAKAVSRAKSQMVTVQLTENTIPHEIEVRYAGARVLLKPAAAGTGVIAGGAVRNVVEAAGIHDLLTKSLGSTNKVNNAYATVLALSKLKSEGTVRHKAAAKLPDVVRRVKTPVPAAVFARALKVDRTHWPSVCLRLADLNP
jgi:ribosomal protein S5